MDRFVKEKIRITCERLYSLSEHIVQRVPALHYAPYDAADIPQTPDILPKLARGESLEGGERNYWLHATIETPRVADTERLTLVFSVRSGGWDASNPQALLYLDGQIVQGYDANHREAVLQPNRRYDVRIHLYTASAARLEPMLDVKAIHTPARALYYDMKVPYDALKCFAETDYAYLFTVKQLEQACNRLELGGAPSDAFFCSVGDASAYLAAELYGKDCGKIPATVSYIGHTHIDVAWLWTLAQTREKVKRSFSTVLNLMERYPDYVFMSSQPQLYAYLKEDAPELYERVKEQIRAGRWEAEGAMWLEADCNLTSGESLVRQIMHGKRFMKEEFGVENRVLWLPDVFGYSAAMPQILKKCGVDRFVTSKISWSETNTMPHDTFLWEGIDGTEIFTYFLTAQTHDAYCRHENYTTYNGMATPEMHLGTWERYQDKDYSDEVLFTFGYGDGGGGPTDSMLETIERLSRGLPGLPAAKMSFAGDFLDRAEDNFRKNCALTQRTPKWVGELYLEFHRGTYTSMARNKKANRTGEFLCLETETLAAADAVLNAGEYPQKALDKAWRTLLLNQFHDILPGSSIAAVYEESEREYKALAADIGALRDEKLRSLADNTAEAGIFVYNPNAFPVSDMVSLADGKAAYAENIPPFGWKVLPESAVLQSGDAAGTLGAVRISERTIDSPHYVIRFNEAMEIESLWDKDNEREVLPAGKTANRLCAFEDYPKKYDNWEITSYYKQKSKAVDDVQSVTPITGCGFGGFEVVRRFGNSEIRQQIVAYTHNRRIDFKTAADWKEDHVLLKAIFPSDVHTGKATYEIQFGHVERPTHENTSWDQAKFEVCAHKWGDLSEEGYGVSLLNDCKYGYSALGNEMTLTLIKCGTYPNPYADKEQHEFTYALYPHAGSFRQGGTIQAAYQLNRPLKAVKTTGGGALPAEYSLVRCDAENVIIEAVKRADSGSGLVVRLYDAWNTKRKTALRFGFAIKKAYLCDMLENKLQELPVENGNAVPLALSNFEIATVLVER